MKYRLRKPGFVLAMPVPYRSAYSRDGAHYRALMEVAEKMGGHVRKGKLPTASWYVIVNNVRADQGEYICKDSEGKTFAMTAIEFTETYVRYDK